MGTAGHGDVANAQAGWLIPFRKTTRAHSPTDSETWEEAEYTNALDAEGNVTRTAHAVAFSVFPKSGQGSELRARETDVATTLSATDGKLHDRGIQIVSDQAGDLDVRQLMPIECERLQGFPDGWTNAAQYDTHKYRMLGNAVAVPVVEWIARRIVASHEDEDEERAEDMGTALQERAREIVNERAAKEPRHNHLTRNIKPEGQCPGCDADVHDPAKKRAAKADKPRPKSAPRHCAKFSDALLPVALDLIRGTGIKPNARGIDIFAGTGKGCDYFREHSKLRLEGIELEPEFIGSDLVKVGNATKTGFRKNTFDFAFWSPSYGNRMADKDMRPSVAGTYAKSLGRLASEGSSCHLQWHNGPRGDAYRGLHVDAYTELARILKDGGYALLNIKGHYRNKEYQDVPAWHREALESLGFEFVTETFVATPSQKNGANRERADGEWLYLFRLNKGGSK